MAIKYDVCAARDMGGGYAQGSTWDSVRAEHTVRHRVDITNDAYPNQAAWSAQEIDAFTVCEQVSNVVVNRSLFVQPQNQAGDPSKFIPWVVCRSKRARPEKDSRKSWLVDSMWNTGDLAGLNEDDLRPVDIPGAIEDYPFIKQQLAKSFEEVLYKDLSTDPDGNDDAKTCRLPTGNYFTQPFIRQRPSYTFKQIQFETGFTWTTHRQRLYSTNKEPFDGQSEHKWMITGIDFLEVKCPIAGDPITFADGQLVVYEISLSEREFGWRSDRALIDTHYLSVADDLNEKIPFKSKYSESNVLGYINKDGTEKDDQTEPEFDQWVVQPTIDFAFMKT